MASLLDTAAWRALAACRSAWGETDMRALFATDPQRCTAFSLRAAGILLDYSKNRIDAAVMEALCALARARGVEAQRDAMFAGEAINTTEGRAVMHWALRRSSEEPALHAGRDVMPEVHALLEGMTGFAEMVRDGRWLGHTGEAITDVVNIGIGGSDLGPLMMCEALKPYGHSRLRMHFVSNVDGAQLIEVLRRVRPERTLFVVVSKTFTTQETLCNARSARAWFLSHGAPEAAIARHFVAVSTNAAKAAEFGIDPANMFGFWDWVGGRYSLWSAVGLAIALSVGGEAFRDVLAGAEEMDRHFREARLECNMPVILALLGVWYRGFFSATSHCVVPYAQYLHRLPAYLQQLDMESNGKSVGRGGERLAYPTGPVIWGEPGTNGQHAYFQLLHQGTDLIPVDFIVSLSARHGLPEHQRLLLANCFAQAEALMRGRSAEEVAADPAMQALPEAERAALLPHKVFSGNRPSNTLVLQDLSPHSLGALVALYEHKVFVQGVIWGLNSFDQWGVELGKQLAGSIAAELESGRIGAHDVSTQALIELALQANPV